MSPGRILAFDHVQLAIPAGGEPQARRAELHLGVEADFRPARKPHPALRPFVAR